MVEGFGSWYHRDHNRRASRCRNTENPIYGRQIRRHQALLWLTLYVLQTHNPVAVPGLIPSERDRGRRPDRKCCCKMLRKASSQPGACIKVISNSLCGPRPPPGQAHLTPQPFFFVLWSPAGVQIFDTLYRESALDIHLSSVATIAGRGLEVRHEQGMDARDV